MKNKNKKESDIQREVCEYLFDRKKYFGWRQNTTPVFDATKKVFRRMPKYSMRGVPDIIILTDGGYAVFLEIKQPKAKLSEHQEIFKKKCEDIGCEYYKITDVRQLTELGL